MALVASIFLLFRSACHPGQLTPAIIYCITLLATYASSMVYHGCPNRRVKKYFRKLDHATIYMTIAGSWTPIFLLSLPQEHAIPSVVLLWTISVLGTIYKIFLLGRFPKTAVISYLLLGWGGMIWFPSLVDAYGLEGISLLMGGGAMYTIGVYFYNRDHIPYYHTIWHLLVMGGSIMHFLLLWGYVFV